MLENFYAIEGLDGVGKSTVIGGLKDRGYFVDKTPPSGFDRFRTLFDKAPIRTRFNYFLVGVVLASKNIKEKANGVPVFCDRYLLTTVSAHESMGIDKGFLSKIKPILEKILKPEKTIVLIADEETRLQRMYKRGANENDRANLKINDKILEGYRRWADELGYNLVEVDTSNLTPDETIREIERNLHGDR